MGWTLKKWNLDRGDLPGVKMSHFNKLRKRALACYDSSPLSQA
jgi:hypothetical protein